MTYVEGECSHRLAVNEDRTQRFVECNDPPAMTGKVSAAAVEPGMKRLRWDRKKVLELAKSR
jgi:hypothetical protein